MPPHHDIFPQNIHQSCSVYLSRTFYSRLLSWKVFSEWRQFLKMHRKRIETFLINQKVEPNSNLFAVQPSCCDFMLEIYWIGYHRLLFIAWLQLGICATHQLFDHVSFVVGCFPDFSLLLLYVDLKCAYGWAFSDSLGLQTNQKTCFGQIPHICGWARRAPFGVASKFQI